MQAPTQASVMGLVMSLVQPKNRADLRATIDRFVAPDVLFVHTLGLFEGRDSYYSALRLATASLRYFEVDFRDVFLSAPQEHKGSGSAAAVVVKAALVVVLRVRVRALGPLSPTLEFPTIAVVHFVRSQKEADPFLLSRHVDSNSLVALLSALSPLRVPWRLVERRVLPIFGACASVAAWAIDAGAAARDAACAAAATFLRPLMLAMD